MKRINKFLSLFLVLISLLVSIPFIGCNGSNNDSKKDSDIEVDIKPSGTPFVNKDFKYLYGYCETPVNLLSGVDGALTDEWISEMGQAMGMKCFRIWASLADLYQIDENDNFVRNDDYANRLHNFVATMKSKGIERFSLLMGGRIMLKGYEEYSNSSIPDPTSDLDLYLRQINAEVKAYTMLARDFPEIEYFEPINEPDHYMCSAINKFGYVYNPLSVDSNTDYIFTTEETARIIMDYCWYIRRAIKSENPNGKLLFPALCHFASSPLFLETCYKMIYSKTLPAGQEYSDTDPDNYFDVLNWHPYSNGMFGVGDEIGDLWIERQNEFHDVACAYGDAEKPAWFTEFGYSDGGNVNIKGVVNPDGTITGQAPQGYTDVFRTIKEKLPFVETIFCFRLTDMYSMKYDSAAAGENSFGLFYNPQDPEKRGMPKPSALAIAQYIKGGLSRQDMDELFKYYLKYNDDIPEEYKVLITK